MRIVCIGCGGIGGHALPNLCRFLYAERRRAHVICVDGDTFELGNEGRMALAHTRENKAIAIARELARAFGDVLTIEPVPAFVTRANVSTLVGEGAVVLLAVDNHATRKLVGAHCGGLADVTLISGGNDGVEDGRDGCFGGVQVLRRAGGVPLTNDLARFHPEIADPADRLPSAEGCEDLAATSAPQLLFTNLAVASAMLNAFWGWLRGTLAYEEVYLDIGLNRVQPVARALE